MTSISSANIAEIEELTVRFGRGQTSFTAVDQVTLTVPAGSALGLVGESGSGKSTIAKALIGAVTPASGNIRLAPATRPARRGGPRRVQYVAQNPYASLSPRRTIGQSLAEALDARHARVATHQEEIVLWLERVGLDGSATQKYPREFSGGQRQRIAIARALCVQPAFLIADEITSALDVSVQFEILRLVEALREEFGFAMLFISHNLPVVAHVCDRVAVMKSGVVVEEGDVREVLKNPRDAYTRALIDAQPGTPGFRAELTDAERVDVEERGVAR